MTKVVVLSLLAFVALASASATSSAAVSRSTSQPAGIIISPIAAEQELQSLAGQFGRTDSLSATCSELADLIDELRSYLAPNWLTQYVHSMVVSIAPSVIKACEDKLREAEEMYARVCEDIFGPV